MLVTVTSGPIWLARKRKPVDPVSSRTSLAGPPPTETVMKLENPFP